MVIYCCGCGTDVDARLTDGREIYPHRPDLAALRFWRCPACLNYVGCHRPRERMAFEYRVQAQPFAVDGEYRPLGNIPTPELRAARRNLHEVIDSIWKGGAMSRSGVYRRIAAALGIPEYHTGEVRTMADAGRVMRIAHEIGMGR